MLSPQKVKGLLAFAATGFGYTHMAGLSALLGANVSTIGLMATACYGLMSLSERNSIS